MKKLFYLLLINLTFLIGQNNVATTSAAFLEIGAGARSLGMGGAFVSVANDASSMYWNPAGLSFHDTKEVYFNHANWIADISFDYFGITIPLNNKSVLGFNLTSVTMDEMEVTRYGNENTGETFAAADYAIGSSYALDLTDRFSVGINGKYVQQSIANSHAKGIAIDIGTLFITPFGFKILTKDSIFFDAKSTATAVPSDSPYRIMFLSSTPFSFNHFFAASESLYIPSSLGLPSLPLKPR